MDDGGRDQLAPVALRVHSRPAGRCAPRHHARRARGRSLRPEAATRVPRGGPGRQPFHRSLRGVLRAGLHCHRALPHLDRG